MNGQNKIYNFLNSLVPSHCMGHVCFRSLPIVALLFIILISSHVSAAESGDAAVPPVPFKPADLVDGAVPPRMTNFIPMAPELLQQGWLSLFDGRTLFGWTASAVSEGTPLTETPSIRVKNAAIHIESPVAIRLSTPRFWPENGTAVFFLSWKNNNKSESAPSSVAPTFLLLDINGKTIQTIPSVDTPDENDPTIMNTIVKTSETQGNGYAFQIQIPAGSFDLSDLRVCYPMTAETFDVTASDQIDSFWRQPDGTMTLVKNEGMELTGKGRLESVQSYGDFMARFEYMPITSAVSGPESSCNSGFFFRCMEGSPLNGYECQINNCPPESDRAKFLGNDTGSIFRRVAARPILDKNNEWNQLAVAAFGPTIRTWINGIPVVCWTDQRAEDENPRKGLRLSPGTFQLQGHDDWTHIRFRNFFVSP